MSIPACHQKHQIPQIHSVDLYSVFCISRLSSSNFFLSSVGKPPRQENVHQMLLLVLVCRGSSMLRLIACLDKDFQMGTGHFALVSPLVSQSSPPHSLSSNLSLRKTLHVNWPAASSSN